MADLIFCSRYPFTKQARDYVSSKGIELSSSLIEKGEERLMEALAEGGKIKRVAELQSAREEELAIYAAARMIASAAANRYLINRLAVAEAKRASDYLASDESAHLTYLDDVAGEFGISFEKDAQGLLVPVSHYLNFTPRSVDYKLTNRKLSAGKVRITKHERIRMLEEAVKKRIESSLPIKADFSPEITAAAKRVLSALPKFETAIIKVGQENYPPCIKKLIEDLAMNVNVPHTGRVALAIYLVQAGVTDDKIVDYFRHAPDFSEKTTRYQVNHLRTRKYSMASCSTMDSWGICVADCRCGTPLNYRDNIHGARLRRQAAETKS